MKSSDLMILLLCMYLLAAAFIFDGEAVLPLRRHDPFAIEYMTR